VKQESLSKGESLSTPLRVEVWKEDQPNKKDMRLVDSLQPDSDGNFCEFLATGHYQLKVFVSFKNICKQ
jgi:hypothetical protein